MTDIDSMIAVLQAAKEGKTIQTYRCGWEDDPTPQWEFRSYMYRVKPEPKVIRVHAGSVCLQPVVHDFENPNLELTFEEGKLVGAKVL